MGAPENYEKSSEEKLLLLKKHQSVIASPRDRGYLDVLNGKTIGQLKAAEVYRCVEVYDNNVKAILAAEEQAGNGS